MISGRFGEVDELIFEIDLIAGNGEVLPVEVMLDTGFTAGYLAIDEQDVAYSKHTLVNTSNYK
mgnify:CR=1 FL=1